MEVLKEHGLEWHSITPNRGHRGREINSWLSNHPVEEYAILDDIREFLPDQLPHFVQTSYIHGLRAKNLTKVERILKL